MNNLGIVCKIILCISAIMIVFFNNLLCITLGLILFLGLYTLDKILGYIKRRNIITDIHTNINSDINFREKFKLTEIIGITTSIIALFNLIVEGNNYTVNIFQIDLYYNRAMYLALVYLIIDGLYSLIESFINLTKITEEGIIFIDGTYVKYKEINYIKYTKTKIHLINKKQVVTIIYSNDKCQKSIVFHGDDFEKFRRYLKLNSKINV
ncbi:hypothetical protein R3379_40420 [Bacillus sp. BAU-SS-2023]|nr:hypothetical protein [Bacillus sp. BAU-SS-2023]